MRMRVLLIALLFLSFALLGEEYKFEMKGVEAKLISEVKGVVPGQKFLMGLKLKHSGGFHTYWRNPGLVGFATQIDWQLPEGFKAGEVQWQVPERAKMLKFNCHAYSGEAILLVEMEAPAVLPEKFQIKAKIGGMSCSVKECCKIGYLDLVYEMYRSEKGESEAGEKEMLEKAKRALPVEEKSLSIQGKIEGEYLHIYFEMKDLLEKGEEVYFYPYENISDTEVEQVVSKLADGKGYLKIKLNQYLPPKMEKIEGVIYRKLGWVGSERQFVKVNFSLK